MSSRTNLNDNTSDRFEFTIGGLDYDFMYPTMEQLQPFTEMDSKREGATPEELAEINAKEEALMYDMIHPVGHTTPIKETLNKQPFPVIKAFNKAIKDQLTME